MALVVLDDDPTGTQAVTGALALFSWTPDELRAAAPAASVHLMTNSRALDPEAAYSRTREAAEACRSALPSAPVVMRGDSTLRGHVWEEYRAVCDACLGGEDAPLVLALALPSAGRVTRDGVHYLERHGETVPLDRTEYARDPSLGYRHARLSRWAHERSDGRLPVDAAVEIGLPELRRSGGGAVAVAVAVGGARAVVVDAETDGDLALVAAGVRSAWQQGNPFAVRCAPALIGSLAGNAAVGHVPLPRGSLRVLVVCGSYVPTTTQQLNRLLASHPQALVQATPAADGGRLARELRSRLERDRLAVLATPRDLRRDLDAAGRERLADWVAGLAGQVLDSVDVLVAKGGVTSAVTATRGVGASVAEVVGPVREGVAMWRLPHGDRRLPYLVVPGNVGGDDLLLDLVEELLAGGARC